MLFVTVTVVAGDPEPGCSPVTNTRRLTGKPSQSAEGGPVADAV